MDLIQLGAEIFSQKLGQKNNNAAGQISQTQLITALTSLLGTRNNNAASGNIDLGALVGQLGQSGALQGALNSWLGDGGNQPVSGSSMFDALGKDKIKDFANQLGIGEDEAADGLAEAVPQMVDKASAGGSLLESFGGTEDLLNMAKKFF